ncbi:MAG: aminopeptidase PepB [Enterobacteriaceae bacterium]
MNNEIMPVCLSTEPAAARWGSKALLSANAEGMTIHLAEGGKLGAVQRAARKLEGQGIKSVHLQGEGWSSERCWAFWQGFYSGKQQGEIAWPESLSEEERETLQQRIDITTWVRSVVNRSAEEMGPQQLAQHVVDLMCAVGAETLSYRMIKGEDLRDQGYTGLHTVGRGSSRSPVLLSMDYNPSGNPDEPVFAALVGKGITFDSGGYSLKSDSTMNSMKADMGGAALAAGALALAIAQGLSRRVKLILCCADNLVSGGAFKQGDIIRYRNGKSVEVMNTDAEGRLVLADGLIDADASHPELLIDCATLTGAAKTAVGNDYHSVLSYDDGLAEELLACARQEHENFWRLPLAEFHRSQLPSSFADLSNIAGTAHSAGASTAAAFLSYFIEKYDQGWLHIDCSATYRKSAVDQWATGATGVGVRTLARLLLNRAGQSA